MRIAALALALAALLCAGCDRDRDGRPGPASGPYISGGAGVSVSE